MKKTFLILSILLLACAAARAQSFQYGKPEELKGLKKIYVHTSTDLKARNKIIDELEKSKIGFEIVDDENDAEIVLMLATGKTDGDIQATTSRVWGTDEVDTTVKQQSLATGKGLVFI